MMAAEVDQLCLKPDVYEHDNKEKNISTILRELQKYWKHLADKLS